MTTEGFARRGVGQWWKAWVLLAGLGATVLGWMALPRDESPVSGGISSQVSMSAGNSPVDRAERIDRPRRVSTSIRMLPGMPQKPVFQAPVTRTRRS